MFIRLAMLVVSAGMWLFTLGFAVKWAFKLMNRPSTVALTIGVGTLLALAAVHIALIPACIRGARTMLRAGPAIRDEWKKGSALAILAVLVSSCCGGCTRVGAGYVGIEINLAGDDRGVDEIPIQTGWVFYNPFTTSVFEYPTFVQTATWQDDEQISFNSSEGLMISGDISLSYQLSAEQVPEFYVKFREDKLRDFTHGFMRNVARDMFNEVGGNYSVEAVYGPQKEAFLREVRERLNESMQPYGITIEQFGFIGAPRPPKQIIEALNAKVAATQDAMRAENQLRQATAEAQKRVAMAKGEAEANKLLAESISDELIQWRTLEITAQAIERWDGRRPAVEGGGGGGLLLQVPMPDRRE